VVHWQLQDKTMPLTQRHEIIVIKTQRLQEGEQNKDGD